MPSLTPISAAPISALVLSTNSEGAGAADGVGSAVGVGYQPWSPGVGVSDGVGEASAVGSLISGGAGASAGISTAAAIATAIAEIAGQADGVGVASAIGSAEWAWTLAGLPCPYLADYGYEIDAGLLRTPMDDGATRQRRRWTTNRTTLSLAFRLTAAQLGLMETLLAGHWQDICTLPVIIGDDGSSTPTDHDVLFTSNLDVSALSPNLYSVSIQAEIA